MLSLFDEAAGAAIAPRGARLAEIGGFLACCGPLYVLNVFGWANAMLFLAAIASGVLLARRDLPPLDWGASERRWAFALCAAFTLPLLTTVLGATLRHHFHQELFDAPSRFLLAIPVMLFVSRSRLRTGAILQWIVLCSVVFGLLQLEAAGPDPKWQEDRQTTLVVDPIVFGYLTLSFGLMCLVSITPRDWREGPRWGVLLRVLGAIIGLWLSVRSGTRSGWAAVPIVLAVWLHHHWGRGHRLATVAVIAVAVLVPLAAYRFVPEVTERIDQFFFDWLDYWRHVVPPESSVGLRITYLRIAVDAIAQHPLAGVGETARFGAPPASLFPYATPAAVYGAFHSGFHNQLVSDAVRNGLGGLVSTSLLLFVPWLVCVRGVRRTRSEASKDAMMGLVFTTCLVVSSMTTEIVDLKFMASLYALMTAVLCGAVLRRRAP
jgi:O-antigen ligase